MAGTLAHVVASHRLPLVPLLALLAGVVACPGNANDPGTTLCKGQPRARIDCASEIKYEGINTSGGVSILNVANAQAKFEEVAIRRINEHVEKYVAAQVRVCREYNACVSDEETYRAEAKSLRDRLVDVQAVASKLGGAGSDGEHKRVLSQLYQRVVPPEARPEDIEFKMSITAELPAELGSLRSGPFVVRPGEPLPTGARVAFTFEVSKGAHLYIFQSSPASGLTVLFPDARIGTANPLPANEPRRIPDGSQTFRLNDKDLGTEWIYLTVSTRAIDVVQAALRKVSAGQVTRLTQDSTLSAFSTLAPGKATPGCNTRALELAPAGPSPCARTRGLVLDDPEDASARSSMSVRTDPGDDAIVKAFPFEHVTAQEYPRARAVRRADARGSEDARRRHGVMGCYGRNGPKGKR